MKENKLYSQYLHKNDLNMHKYLKDLDFNPFIDLHNC